MAAGSDDTSDACVASGRGENATVEEIMEMMSTLRARHIPVEKDGRLVGIISIGDVVKAHIRSIEFEAAEIKAYISS